MIVADVSLLLLLLPVSFLSLLLLLLSGGVVVVVISEDRSAVLLLLLVVVIGVCGCCYKQQNINPPGVDIVGAVAWWVASGGPGAQL